MKVKSEMTYIYDGSYEGLLTCVFRCYEDKFIPGAVITGMTLTPFARVFTDRLKAARVTRGVVRTMGRMAENVIRTVYLADDPGKELAIVRFIVYGMKAGERACRDLAHPDVAEIYEIYRAVNREKRMCLERLKFSVIADVLVAVVEPTHNVLPLIGRHFVERFPEEDFFIYDKAHKLGLTYSRGKLTLAPVENFEPGEIDGDEEAYRRLWKIFFQTVEIRERRDPRAQRAHMPSRYSNFL